MKEKKRKKNSKGKVMKMKRRRASNSSLCHRITCSALRRRSRGEGQCILLPFHTQEATQPCPKLTRLNKTPLTHRQPPRTPVPPLAPEPSFAFPDWEPCLISQESHIDGVRQLSPDGEKRNLALTLIQLCPPLCPSDPRLSTHINNQRKETFPTSADLLADLDSERGKC